MHTYHDFAVVFCHVLTLRLALDLMDIWRSFATMQSLPTWANRCIRSTYRVRVSTVLVHAVDNPSLVVVVVLDFAPNACHFAVVFCHLSYSSLIRVDSYSDNNTCRCRHCQELNGRISDQFQTVRLAGASAGERSTHAFPSRRCKGSRARSLYARGDPPPSMQ